MVAVLLFLYNKGGYFGAQKILIPTHKRNAIIRSYSGLSRSGIWGYNHLHALYPQRDIL